MSLFDAPTRSDIVAVLAGPDRDDEPAISFTVHGTPGPQGSKSAFTNRHTGKAQMRESSKKVAPWRQDVKHAALGELLGHTGFTLLDGPLAVSMVFTFPRPKAHWRTGRNSHLLSTRATVRPIGYPDLSKLARSSEDALTNVVWTDDSRIVEYRRLGKYWAGDDAPDVLAEGAGAVIRVWTLDTTDQTGDTP